MKNQNKRFFALRLIIFLVLMGQLALAQNDVYLASYSGQSEIRAKNSVTLGDGFYIQAPIRPVRIYTSPTFINCITLNAAPSPNLNYILSRVFKLPGVNESNITANRNVCEESVSIQYIDGLGRPLQTVIVQGSPSFADIIQPMEYDALGRASKKYLPYTVAGNNGAFKMDALYDANVGQQAFYGTPPSNVTANTKPYSNTIFTDDPRSKVLKHVAAGSDNLHAMNTEYGSNNNITDSSDPYYKRVKRYIANSSINQPTTLTDNGWYGDSELYLTIKKDENWQYENGRAGTSESYVDKAGRVILARIWEDANTPLSTYYVYDKFGNLSFILPPKATPDQSNTVTQDVINTLCIQYRYDQYDRLVEKKLPGVGPVYFVYNKLDQLVMSQDANQRIKTPQEWTFSKYDAQGRTITTGVYQHLGSTSNGNVNGADNANRIALQADFTNQATVWESRENSGIGYTNVALPTSNIVYLTINYFDNYNIPNLPTLYDDRNNHSKKTDGLPTAQLTAVLNDPSKMLWSVNYYDKEGHIEKSFSQHFKGGVIDLNNYDEVDNEYSFIGELKSNTRNHRVGVVNTSISNRYEYDHMGRKLADFQNINGQGEVVLSKITYNELGQLSAIQQHSTDGANFLNQTTYSYTNRGWLSKSESSLFKLNLKYSEGGNPQYNGNISSVSWGNNLEKTFNYEYDKLNRLISGAANGMVENGISYDKMGNIKTLTRDGQGISYSYINNGGVEGNQLQSVSGYGLSAGTYVYDLNGNVVTDGSKNNIQLGYNLLNLPQLVSGSQNVSYTYDAAGAMLNKQSVAIGLSEYISGVQYTNGSLDFIKVSGGRAVRQLDNSYLYQYDVKDHLGNVRLSYDRDPNSGLARRIQEDDYYPFGKRKSVAPVSLNNNYLYNGKELQNELGEYDYGARFYNPELGRWNVQDPKTEKYAGASPYNYVLNNPVALTDPDGMDPFPMINQTARIPYPDGLMLQANITPSFSFSPLRGTFTFGLGGSIALVARSPIGQAVYEWSGRVYNNGGLGTSAFTKGWQYDLTESRYFTLGGNKDKEEGAGMSIYTLNYLTRSAAINPYRTSITYGVLRTYNSATNSTTKQGLFGIRIGNFSLSTNNDVDKPPLYFGGGTDQGWTGGIVLSLLEKGNLYEFGFQDFTSIANESQVVNDDKHYGHYNQSDEDVSLNRADTFFRINGYRLSLYGPGWLQNLIHNTVSPTAKFHYNFRDIQLGYDF